MVESMDAEAYLFELYRTRFEKSMDEMKMHKLMYFSQRESLVLNEEPLFNEEFFGWKYGPVLHSVRAEYKKDFPYKNVEDTLDDGDKSLLNSVMERYGGLSSWTLSSLSHDELSWIRARKVLKAGENGNVKMELNAMKVDAARERSLRKRDKRKSDVCQGWA